MALDHSTHIGMPTEWLYAYLDCLDGTIRYVSAHGSKKRVETNQVDVCIG
jgi:hypothetical protein